MLDDEKFMLTVFTGKSAEEADNQAIEAHVREAHPDVECYFIEGGQDVYPYIFIVE
jgi:dihydroxyacetone kinase-like predicted kinase